MKRVLIRGLVAVGGVLASLTLAAGAVSAHAALVSADPANGSMLVAGPDHVELVFSENVGKPAALAVLDQSGSEIEGGELQVIDDTMSRTYDPASFAPGVYTISYQVVSADGHPIAGELTFMVHGEGESVTPVPPAASTGSRTDAEPAVVISLAVLLAMGLGAALLIVKRMVALPDNPSV